MLKLTTKEALKKLQRVKYPAKNYNEQRERREANLTPDDIGACRAADISRVMSIIDARPTAVARR